MNEQERIWREQEVARQAMEYCEKYLIEYIKYHSLPSKFARSLGRFSKNDDEIIYTIMSSLEDIYPLEKEFDIKNFRMVVTKVIMALHDLERFHTKEKLIVELKAVGYMK
ncbi:MAG: hypothetical protein IMF07_07085 [Proteobacteria bacterium]|nr:hypothetical protein [Pseudomonadota bacterium]